MECHMEHALDTITLIWLYKFCSKDDSRFILTYIVTRSKIPNTSICKVDFSITFEAKVIRWIYI